jgi:TonB family protein
MLVDRFEFLERRRYVHCFGAGAVVAAHVLAVWTLINYSVSTTSRVSLPASPITIILLTPTEVSSVPPQHVSTVRAKTPPKKAARLVSNIHMTVKTEVASLDTASSATVVAPRVLEEILPDLAPFAKMARLSPGQRSLVVLRVEILIDGSVGRIRIDVSSGNKLVDEAAMKYAQLTRWLPGSVGGIKENVWARYGVQLTA